MSSVVRRIIIEEYFSGGWGILEYDKRDVMGIADELDLIFELIKKLGDKK